MADGPASRGALGEGLDRVGADAASRHDERHGRVRVRLARAAGAVIRGHGDDVAVEVAPIQQPAEEGRVDVLDAGDLGVVAVKSFTGDNSGNDK